MSKKKLEKIDIMGRFRAEALASLEEQLKSALEEHFHLKMRHKVGALERPHLLRDMRKKIARLMTVLNEQKRGSV